MKKFITPSYTFTPNDSGVGTVDLSGISNFNIKKLIAIINQTQGVVIYSTANPDAKYTNVSGTVVTLFYDTSTHDSGDVLQIIYEDEAPISVTQTINSSGDNVDGTISTTESTQSAPSGCVGFILMNLDTSTSSIRWAIGQLASSTTGQQLQAGRDTGYIPCGGDISLCAESGTQNFNLQWILQ